MCVRSHKDIDSLCADVIQMTREVFPQSMDISYSMHILQFLFHLCGRVTQLVDRVSSVETSDRKLKSPRWKLEHLS